MHFFVKAPSARDSNMEAFLIYFGYTVFVNDVSNILAF